jgi:hypothetical protein
MQEGQSLGIVKGADLGQETGQQIQHPVGFLPKPGKLPVPVTDSFSPLPLPVSFQKGVLGTGLNVRRRQC